MKHEEETAHICAVENEPRFMLRIEVEKLYTMEVIWKNIK